MVVQTILCSLESAVEPRTMRNVSNLRKELLGKVKEDSSSILENGHKAETRKNSQNL